MNSKDEWNAEMDRLVQEFHDCGMRQVQAGCPPLMVFDGMTSAVALWFNLLTYENSPLRSLSAAAPGKPVRDVLHDRLGEFIKVHLARFQQEAGPR